MGKKMIASIGLSLVVQEEITDGHIFTMQYRLFQRPFVKIGKSNMQSGIVTGAATFCLRHY